MAPRVAPDWDRADALMRRLYAALLQRRHRANILAGYYDGDQPLGFASSEFRQTFGWLLGEFADNWCQVGVGAKEERLRVEGFRGSGSAEVDAAAWAHWQRNNMDAGSQLAHTEALIHGENYVTVWVGDDDEPVITPEHPARAIVLPHHHRLHESLAGLRTWTDTEGHERLELFTPEYVYLYRSERPASSIRVVDGDGSVVPDKWERCATDYEDALQPNKWGRVMMTALPNRPKLTTAGPLGPIWRRSELAPLLPLQNMLNKLMVDMIVTSEAQSMRQRWATGLELEYDDAGNPKKPFKGGAARLWVAEDAEVKFGEFGQVDLTQFTKAADSILVHLASIGAIPPHYLNASADRLSGESIKAAESGLVSRVRRMMIHFGDAWEQVMRHVGMVADDDGLANAADLETVWANPEIRTDSALADSVGKKADIGVTWRQCMEDLGYSPQQIDAMRRERTQDALLGVLNRGVSGGASDAAGTRTGAADDATLPAS